MTSRNTKGSNNKKANAEQLIAHWIDTYLESGGNTARQSKRRIQSYNPKTIVFNALDKKISKAIDSDKKKLILLGLSISREKYIHVFLASYGADSVIIDESRFLTRISAPQLNLQEERILAEYIAEHWNYDFRLLDYVHGDNLTIALDGILRDSEGHVLKDKHLRALSRSKNHLAIIQPRINALIDKGPKHRRKAWLPFLDLAKKENQEVIISHYNLIEIYEQFCDADIQYHESPYIALRIPLKLICTVQMNAEELNYLKKLIIESVNTNENIEDNRTVIRLLEDTARVDQAFAESLLVIIYHRTKLYTRYVFDILVRLKSSYAYHELINTLLVTDNQNLKFVALKTLLNNYPEKKDVIVSYTNQISDDTLTRFCQNTLDALKIRESKQTKMEISFANEIPCKIISKTATGNEVNEILIDIANSINADTFYASVGFAYASGLRLLSPLIGLIQKNNGNFELIVGALQGASDNTSTSKIDKKSAMYLNTLLQKTSLKLYTYEDAFFHGKFYYLANRQVAYVVIGSSNISKTAFFDNCELDLLFKIDLQEDKNNPFREWYDSFKGQCTQIKSLNEDLYTDFDWDSELSVFSERFIRDFSREDLEKRIESVGNVDTQNRLKMWLKHNPNRHSFVHNISALREYFVMEFKNHNLAVFESFEHGNAFYVFSCDNFNQLLMDVSQMSKTQLQKYTLYKTRGIHTPDLKRLQENIDRLFMDQEEH